MKMIVGLGNPGSEYCQSRHNVGFCLVDELSKRWSIELTRRKHQGRYGNGQFGGEQVVLLKPQTYMNCSGSSVAEAVRFGNMASGDLLVVLDDMALETGRLRLRSQGSAGGHNGLADIIEKLGTEEFGRLRIGIGPPGYGDAVGHVLGKFSPEEEEIVGSSVKRAAEAVECWIQSGMDKTMTEFNKQ